MVASNLTLSEVNFNNDNFDKILSDADLIVEFAKNLIVGNSLDRHKIHAAISIAIMLNSPLTPKHPKPQVKTHLANETIAVNFCTHQLYYNMLSEFITKNPKVSKDDFSKDHPFFEFPKPSRVREEPVVESLLKALSFYNTYALSLKNRKVDVSEIAMGSILLISHIYFYIESYNLTLWHDAFKSKLSLVSE